jgi:1,4-alpha-glucan branching enzyme
MVAVRHDTVHVVRFVLVAPTARHVALVGDFNDWDRTATRLRQTGSDGVWTASISLPPGRHQYAFIVDDTQWRVDPAATLSVDDEFGTTTSIISVGAGSS